jgi:predicted ester cyclase
MPAEQNKAALRRIYEEVFNKGNLAAVDEVVTADWIYHGAGGMELKGPAGFKEFVKTYRAAFPDLHLTAEDMVAEGEKVAHRITFRGTNTGEFMGVATISHFVGGREAETWQFADTASMYEQLGVAPPMGQPKK